MGAQHDATVGMDSDKCKPHDVKPMLHGTCTTGPERTDMRSLLTRLADVARIYGYSQQTIHIEVTSAQCKVELHPVYAFSTTTVEVRSVGLLTLGAVTLHLSEIYVSLYRHVQ